MLTKQDELLLNSKGIAISDFEKQLADFKNGFPFLKIESAATVGNGVVRLKENEVKEFTTVWDSYKAEKHKVVKFVPASGAASRMFKDLFAFLEAAYDAPTTDFEKFFFDNLKHFAFYNELNEKCRATHGKDIAQLVEAGNHKAIVATLLHTDGLNYGQLPKGLLLFHKYAEGERTAMEEHLVEAAQYAACGTEAHVHFTVSHEHLELFKEKEGIIFIDSIIYVERETQKGILIGHKGEAIKKVGTEARLDLEKFFAKKIHLNLFVKVKKDWRKNEKDLKNFGYR